MALYLRCYQPFKALYLTYFFTSLVFVRIPYWVLIYLLPSARPRASWTLRRAVLVRALRSVCIAIFNSGSWKSVRWDPKKWAKDPEKAGLVYADGVPELIVGEIKTYAERNKVTIEPVSGFWYGKRDASGRLDYRAGPDEKVFYGFHAGGFVLGDSQPGGLTGNMYEQMLREMPQFSRVFALNYRLAQAEPFPIENPFPTALIDAVMGYNYLVNEMGFKPSNIVPVGESAGGTIVTQLVKYTVVSGLPAIPPPGGLFLMCPSLDWGNTHNFPKVSTVENRPSDWVQGFVRGYCNRSIVGHLPMSEAQTNWWISPASLKLAQQEGTFKGFPPTLFMIGGAEMGADPMRTGYRRLVADIGQDKVTLLEVPDATHIPLGLPYHDKERKWMYKKIREWVKKEF